MNNLVKQFEKSGKTQAMIAAEIGIHYSTVSRAITDPGRAAWHTLRNVAAAIGIGTEAAADLWKTAKREAALARIRAKYV